MNYTQRTQKLREVNTVDAQSTAMRISSLMAALVFFAMLLVGTAAAQGTAENPVELRMWFGRQDFIPADNFAAFHEEYPFIRVTTDVIPLEQAPADFVRNYRAGNEPDLFQVHAELATVMAAQGVLHDMTQEFERWQQEEPQTYEGLAPVAFGAASYDGAPYGLGVHVGPKWLVYRLDWFTDAGLAAPETFDDIIEAARVMASEGHIGFAIIGSRQVGTYNKFAQLFLPLGGEWVDGIPQLDSEAGIYLLSFYRTLLTDGLADAEMLSWGSGDMRAAFMGGRAAMTFTGDNVFSTINNSLTWGEEWSAITVPPRPGAEDTNLQLANSWPYYVSANTEHPYEASLVLRYLARPEIVQEVAFRYQPTSVLSVLEDSAYTAAKPWAPDFQEAFAGLVMNDPPGHVRQTDVVEIVLDAIQEVLLNANADPAEVAARHQVRLDALR